MRVEIRIYGSAAGGKRRFGIALLARFSKNVWNYGAGPVRFGMKDRKKYSQSLSVEELTNYQIGGDV